MRELSSLRGIRRQDETVRIRIGSRGVVANRRLNPASLSGDRGNRQARGGAFVSFRLERRFYRVG